MSDVIQTLFEVPPGYRSTHVARYLWHLDDLTRRLFEATADATAEELEWQVAPGTNSLGMLFTHVAVAEAHMSAIGLERLPESDVPGLLGLRTEDDGFPLAPGAAPPAHLRGKEIGYFHELIRKARTATRHAATRLADTDLEHLVNRPRPDGKRRLFNVEWMLYHLTEHFAGHSGQILLMRHLHRVVRTRP